MHWEMQGIVLPLLLRAGPGSGERWDHDLCAIYWLTDLAREGKVRITGVELVRAAVLPVPGPAPIPPEDY